MSNICRFTNIADMAEFCAGLTKANIAFNTFSKGDEYVVEITGF